MGNPRDNIFGQLASGSKQIESLATPNRSKIRSVFRKEEGSLIEIFEKKLTAVNGNFNFSPNRLSLQKDLRLFFKKKQINTIHTYETAIQEILLKSSIPYTSSPEDMAQVEVSATGCEFIVARLGTILVSSQQTKSRKIICFPPTHIVIAPISKLVYDLPDALEALEKKYAAGNYPAMISLITGPSRTADIEKTLILGAHGPKELFVFLFNDK